MGQIKIAFVGKSKIANTFCARYLQSEYKFKFLGLDDELDRFLRILYNANRKNSYPKAINYQTRLRFYDAFQRIDPDVWVRRALYHIGNYWESTNVAIPDARYMNEIEALKQAGFIFIRVTTTQYSPKTTHVKTLKNDTNPGAVDYYEWFAKDADFYVQAKYSVHVDDHPSARKELDQIIKNLTEENSIS